MERKIRMSKQSKMTKESILVLANKLGYTIEFKTTQLYLVKNDVWIHKKSYNQAYQYLYYQYRMAKKKIVANQQIL